MECNTWNRKWIWSALSFLLFFFFFFWHFLILIKLKTFTIPQSPKFVVMKNTKDLKTFIFINLYTEMYPSSWEWPHIFLEKAEMHGVLGAVLNILSHSNLFVSILIICLLHSVPFKNALATPHITPPHPFTLPQEWQIVLSESPCLPSKPFTPP